MALTGSSAFAVDSDLEQLQEQVRQLIAQNQQLSKRVAAMEQERPAQPEPIRAGGISSSPVPEELLRTKVQQQVLKEIRRQQEAEGKSQQINDYVTLFGLIEAEAVVGDDFAGDAASEFNVATVELGFDAQLSDWVVGHILAKYEGGEEDQHLFIDEANIWLGNYQKFPVLLTAGKFYLPFGQFDTNMVQDPLTLEVGEINAPGLAIGVEQHGFTGALYSYKGMNETDGNDTIKGFGAMLSYHHEIDETRVDAGASWVSNLADSGGISDAFDGAGLDSIIDQVPGFGVYLTAGYGPFSLISEYIQAIDPFAPSELDFKGEGAQPKAWNAELAYATALLGKETIFAVGYQGTAEALALELPYARYMGAVSMVLFEGTSLTLEYFHDSDYDEDEGGSGEDADVFTAQLAYEF